MARVCTYLNFDRSTLAAFEFYSSVFGGEFIGGVRLFGDEAPTPDDAQLVMHVALPILGGHVLMGTDAPASMGFTLRQGNAQYISLEPDSRAETQQLFSALSEGGTIQAPLADMPWGGYFGTLADKFGVLWMLNFRSAE